MRLVLDKGKPAARRGRKAYGPLSGGGGRAAEGRIALPGRLLTLTLISAELSCALLWALTGAVVACALALALGLGAVLVACLSDL